MITWTVYMTLLWSVLYSACWCRQYGLGVLERLASIRRLCKVYHGQNESLLHLHMYVYLPIWATSMSCQSSIARDASCPKQYRQTLQWFRVMCHEILLWVELCYRTPTIYMHMLCQTWPDMYISSNAKSGYHDGRKCEPQLSKMMYVQAWQLTAWAFESCYSLRTPRFHCMGRTLIMATSCRCEDECTDCIVFFPSLCW